MVWAAAGVGVALLLILTLIPFMEQAFGVYDLNLIQWVYTIGLAFTIIPFVEIEKLVLNIISKNKAKKEAKLLAEEIIAEELETENAEQAQEETIKQNK